MAEYEFHVSSSRNCVASVSNALLPHSNNHDKALRVHSASIKMADSTEAAAISSRAAFYQI